MRASVPLPSTMNTFAATELFLGMRPSSAHWAYINRLVWPSLHEGGQVAGRAADDPHDAADAHAPIYYSFG